MKKLFLSLLIVSAWSAHAQQSKNSPAEFIVQTADSRLANKEAARFAQSLGSTSEIREFAGTMMKDAESMYAEINQLAVSKGITVGSSRVDLQACKLEYSIVSPK